MNHGYYHHQHHSAANPVHPFLAVAGNGANTGNQSGDHTSAGQTVYPIQYIDSINRATPTQEQIVYTNGQAASNLLVLLVVVLANNQCNSLYLYVMLNYVSCDKYVQGDIQCSGKLLCCDNCLMVIFWHYEP